MSQESRAGTRVALGLLLTATFYLLYSIMPRHSITMPPGLMPTPKGRQAVNPGLESANMRPGGRWQVLYDVLVETDALSNGLNSISDPLQVNWEVYNPMVHDSDSSVTEGLPRAAPQQPLHFGFDSLDEGQGRDISTSHGHLLDAFRTLARREREETRRRLAGKSKLRDRELQITVTAQ